MKILLYFIVSIFYSFIFIFSSHAETGDIDESKSIKEIQQSIQQLHQDRNNINNELTVLTQNNNFILYLVKNGFFRNNITRTELENIEYLVTNYNTSFAIINKTLLDKSKNLKDISAEKKLLLNLKKDLYQDFIPYISNDKYLEYLDFIRGDAKITKKDSDVKYSLVKNKEILNTKVTKIEERIVEERRKMSEQLKVKVSIKIDEKINNISTNEKYISLSPELKEQVIKKTIEKVQERIKSTKELENNDNILFQKIEVFELLEEKLLIFYNELLEQNKKEG